MSLFTDSAVDMSKTEAQSGLQNDTFSETFEPSLSERLEQLTTAVWEAEQDCKFSKSWTQGLHKDLNTFERHLDNETQESTRALDIASESPEAASAQDERLREVLDHLADTISSMRLRQQEHRHLHQLSRSKLEAVAQRCLVQETQLLELKGSLEDLQHENRQLGAENETLRRRVEELEAEATRREIAVDAMTSAVAGLEGWIETAGHGIGDHTQSPGSRRTPRRTVIRGRGRFRGKYYIDDIEGGGSRHGFDDGSDAKDLHDGVRAWLRGFRDVEEEARSDRTRTSKEAVEDPTVMDEEWGDFEVVT